MRALADIRSRPVSLILVTVLVGLIGAAIRLSVVPSTTTVHEGTGSGGSPVL